MLRTITSKVVDEDYETLCDQKKVELGLSVQAICDIQTSVAQFFDNTVFDFCPPIASITTRGTTQMPCPPCTSTSTGNYRLVGMVVAALNKNLSVDIIEGMFEMDHKVLCIYPANSKVQ